MDDNKVFDLGLGRAEVSKRSFISAVYFWMSAGLALTGVVALWMSASPNVVMGLARNPFLMFMLFLIQMGLVFGLSAAVMRIDTGVATFCFGLYAVLNGILFSGIFLVYTGASIAATFFVTAGTFAGLSVYGFTTKQDLTSVGSFCIMGIWGLILGTLVNWFFKSPAFDWILTYIGIALFVGLTASDTQKIKRLHEQGVQENGVFQKMALIGALMLYLDFINLFLLMLRVMGRRK